MNRGGVCDPLCYEPRYASLLQCAIGSLARIYCAFLVSSPQGVSFTSVRRVWRSSQRSSGHRRVNGPRLDAASLVTSVPIKYNARVMQMELSSLRLKKTKLSEGQCHFSGWKMASYLLRCVLDFNEVALQEVTLLSVDLLCLLPLHEQTTCINHQCPK